MKHLGFVLFLLSVISLTSCAQSFSYEWQRVAMDDTYESGAIYEADKIISRSQEQMDSLMEIVTYRSKQTEKTELVDMASMAVLEYIHTNGLSGLPVTLVINKAAVRNPLPKGAIRKYDLYVSFPYENNILLVNMRGSMLKKVMDRFGEDGKYIFSGSPEPSGSDDSLYTLATIDYLVDNGDKLGLNKKAEKIVRTGIPLRNIVIEYVKMNEK